MSGISTTLSLDGSPFYAGLRGIEAKLGAFRNTASALTAGFTGILAIGPAISNAFAGITGSISKAGNMESLLTSFEVLLGDARGAKRLMDELVALGAATPFEMSDLAPAAKSLLAFGVAAENVTETLRRVGDISSGIGAPIGEIAEIYGKARVQGRLFAQDINQLTGRGIPVITEFAKQFGVTEGAVRKLVEEGQVGFTNLERAFVDLTSSGGKFAGMMEKQSQTWGGLVSTFKDGVSQLMVAFGTPFIQAMKPQLQAAIAGLGGLENIAKTAGAGFGRFVSALASFGMSLANGVSGLISFGQAFPTVTKGIGAMVLGFVAMRTLGPVTLRLLQTGLTSLSLSMIRSGGQLTIFGALWKTTWAGIAVSFRTAVVAMKSALVSTGIGAALVALGELVGWIYRKVSNLMDRGKSGKAVDEKALRDVEKYADRASKLDSEDARDMLAGEIDADLEASEEEARSAAEADDPRAQALARRVDALKKVAENIRTIPKALLEENAARKQTVELLKDETKKRDEAAKAVERQLEALKKSKFKHELDALPLDQQEEKLRFSFNGRMPDGRHYDRGGLDLAGIEKEIERLKGTTDVGELEYLDKLIEGAEMFLDLNQKRAEQAKKAAEADAEHVARVAQLRAELADQDEKLRKLKAEEKLRERIKQLTDLGVKDAKTKATQEVNLEEAIDDKKRGKTLQDYVTKFRRDMTRIQAELRGDRATVAEMDRQQKVDDYAKEAKEAGVTDPKLARQIAEERANADAKLDAQRNARRGAVADSDRRVGLGGRAIGGTSDPLIRAQQQQTKATGVLTKSISDLNALLRSKPQIVREIVGPVFK